MIDTIFRYHAVRLAAAPLLRRPVPDGRSVADRMGSVLEKVCSGDPVSGAEWGDLTSTLATSPLVVVGVRNMWAEVTERLLAEVMISDGVAWMQRFDSLNTLLSHPSSQEPAISTISTIIDEGRSQSLVGTACLLDASGHPDASRKVLSYLDNPADDRVFKGALMACVRKLHYHHFTADQTTRVAAIAANTVGESSVNEETSSLAVSVLRKLPHEVSTRLRGRLQRELQNNATYSQVLAEDQLASSPVAELVASRIIDHTLGRLAHDVDGYRDTELSSIVREMLFDPVFDARLYAALLIHASPYRAGVADALATELSRAQIMSGSAWVTTLFEALRIIGGPPERSLLERYLVAVGVPKDVHDCAAYALGHVGGVTPPAFWVEAIAHHLALWRSDQSPSSASTLDRIVYALGVAHEWPLLSQLSSTADLPSSVVTSVQWWLTQPVRILASVKQ